MRADARRPLHPLHGRHDRACRRACCGASTTSSCRRWAAGTSSPTRRSRSYDDVAAAGRGVPRAAEVPRHPAADARGGPVGGVHRAQQRPRRRPAARHPRLRPRRGLAHDRARALHARSPSSATPSPGPWSRSSRRGSYDTSSLLSVGNGGAPLTPTIKAAAARAAPQHPAHRRGGLVRDRRPDEPRVERRATTFDRALQPAARHGGRERGPRQGARARPRRHRLAGADGLGPARLPRRPRQDRPHVPRHRRRALLGARRPGPPPRRRRDRAARPRLGHHQLGRREDLRRGGRAGHRRPPRGARRRGRRPAERAVGPGGRGAGRAVRRGRRPPPTTSSPTPPSTSPATSCPKDVLFLDAIQRSPSGKADYRWAKAQVQSTDG